MSQRSPLLPELSSSMFLLYVLSWYLLLYPAQASNDLGVTSSSTVGWVPDPSGRGTLSLVISCIVTFTLCVWSALHLNVPAANSTSCRLALEKTKWVLYGIFAPELVVATAASQYITVRWLKREIEKDAAYRKSQKSAESQGEAFPTDTWNITQCFYAAMGGCGANIPWMDDVNNEALHSVVITPAGIRLLSFVGQLPKICKSQIQDKSKADWMTKSIVCVQASWMVAQVAGRLIKGLPVSLLEINTCGHVACAIVLYLLWWSKPFDVQDPSILEEDALTLLFLCSQISAVNDNIPDIRCFHYNSTRKKSNQFASLSQSPATKAASNTSASGSNGEKLVQKFTTELSLGSYGSKNIQEFIGFKGPAVKIPTENNTFKVEYEFEPMIAQECQQYLQPPYSDLSIRHGDLYCRRAQLQFQDVEGHRLLPAHYIDRASTVADTIWTECDKRPEYRHLYFTIVSELGDMGFYFSETDYLVHRMLNFPSLSNLSLGQVNIHRNLLPSIFAFTALTYGGLHLSAWNYFYPSRVERILWITAALWIASSGALVWAFSFARLFKKKVISDSQKRILYRWNKAPNQWETWLSTIVKWPVYFVGISFAAARVFLVVEAFVSLREAPKQMYLTLDWSDFVPHL
jgi:hypothetical protein